MDVKLAFINRSDSVEPVDVVICQKNQAAPDAPVVAWQAIQRCGQGESHPFTYGALTAAISDSYGNYTAPVPAFPGEQFTASITPSGTALAPSGKASASSAIEIVNGLLRGTINAILYRSGATVAMIGGVAPQQSARFEFDSTLYLGLIRGVEQGDMLGSAMLEDLNTQISLLGIASASIVLTGGGQGASATPFVFTLDNVVYA